MSGISPCLRLPRVARSSQPSRARPGLGPGLLAGWRGQCVALTVPAAGGAGRRGAARGRARGLLVVLPIPRVNNFTPVTAEVQYKGPAGARPRPAPRGRRPKPWPALPALPPAPLRIRARTKAAGAPRLTAPRMRFLLLNAIRCVRREGRGGGGSSSVIYPARMRPWHGGRRAEGRAGQSRRGGAEERLAGYARNMRSIPTKRFRPDRALAGRGLPGRGHPGRDSRPQVRVRNRNRKWQCVKFARGVPRSRVGVISAAPYPPSEALTSAEQSPMCFESQATRRCVP